MDRYSKLISSAVNPVTSAISSGTKPFAFHYSNIKVRARARPTTRLQNMHPPQAPYAPKIMKISSLLMKISRLSMKISRLVTKISPFAMKKASRPADFPPFSVQNHARNIIK